jgi:hypothetical protein
MNQYDCNKFTNLVGKFWEKDVNELDLREVGNFGSIRVIKPNDKVTCDYRPDRLNINIDEDRKITSFIFT